MMDDDGGIQFYEQGEQMKELWFYYYEQALAEGCNEDDAAHMAEVNSASHLADMADRMKDERREAQ